MNFRDRRIYNRYKTNLKGKIALPKGSAFSVDIIDVSIEGARLRTDSPVLMFEGEVINLLIKWDKPIKIQAEIRWIKEGKLNTEFGVKFIEMDMANREALASLVSEHAFSSIINSSSREFKK